MDISAKKAKSMRNAEKRRERSKVAARCRRGKESEIFSDLSASLPIPEASKSALDKASIMRLTLCNLKLKKMMESGFWSENTDPLTLLSGAEFESQINSALGGFILIFSMDGDVIYASEGVTTQLGISQYEIMGQSIFEFAHQYDHSDIRALFKSEEDTNKRSTLFRMKCTVSSRGRNAHLRSANYKVISCTGRVIQGEYFISICEPLLHPSDVDIPLNKQSFLSKHTPDMKFEYVDDSVAELLGYAPEDMRGRSLFQFQHALDSMGTGKAFKSLYEKEQTVTDRYRFLTKGGGWIWVITQATLIPGPGKGPGSVVCIHFITSGKEDTDQILSEVQLGSPAVVEKPHVLTEKKQLNIPTVQLEELNADEENKLIADLLVGPLLNNATCSTAKIFTPRTKEMDTGFLMPVDDNTLIVSKDEPEDLTHLAPIAGDECIQLEDVPMLEDLLASLDDSDEPYSFLDMDSEELPKFPLFTTPTQEKPMAKPIAVQSHNPLLLFQNDPTLTSASAGYSCGSTPDLSITPPPAQNCEGQINYFSNSGTITTAVPAISPIPPDLCFSVPMMEVQAQNPQARFNTVSENEKRGIEDPTTAVAPPPPNWDLLQEAANLLNEGERSPKMQKTELGAEPQRIYILVPVEVDSRRSSISSCSGSDSDSQDGQFQLLDVANMKNQQEIKDALTNMGIVLNAPPQKQKNPITSTDYQNHRKRKLGGSLLNGGCPPIMSLKELTRQDCEVNAPLSKNSDLLQGPELLRALDFLPDADV